MAKYRVAGYNRPENFQDEVAVFDPVGMQVVTAALLLEKRGNAQLVALPGSSSCWWAAAAT